MEGESLSKHLLELLEGGHAHIRFDDVLRDWPAELRAAKPSGAAHSPWEVLDHLRIAQWDIVEFSCSADHVSPEFPKGYWPEPSEPPDAEAWERAIESFHRDLDRIKALVADPEADFFTPFPWGDGQTLFREAMLVADHNAYHLGELMVLRRVLDV